MYWQVEIKHLKFTIGNSSHVWDGNKWKIKSSLIRLTFSYDGTEGVIVHEDRIDTLFYNRCSNPEIVVYLVIIFNNNHSYHETFPPNKIDVVEVNFLNETILLL